MVVVKTTNSQCCNYLFIVCWFQQFLTMRGLNHSSLLFSFPFTPTYFLMHRLGGDIDLAIIGPNPGPGSDIACHFSGHIPSTDKADKFTATIHHEGMMSFLTLQQSCRRITRIRRQQRIEWFVLRVTGRVSRGIERGHDFCNGLIKGNTLSVGHEQVGRRD